MRRCARSTRSSARPMTARSTISASAGDVRPTRSPRSRLRATGRSQEGAVGAGTGTIAFELEGRASAPARAGFPANLGGYTVGVLVQTNYGGVLQIAGVPVGQALGQYYLKDELVEGQRGRLVHRRHRDRRAALRPQPRAPRPPRASRHCANRLADDQRLGRICDRLLDQSRRPPNARAPSAPEPDRSTFQTNRCRRCSKPRSKPPRKPRSTRYSPRARWTATATISTRCRSSRW